MNRTAPPAKTNRKTVFTIMERIRPAANIILPFPAAGAVFANMACDTGCTYLHGVLFGIDLHCLGIVLAAALLLFSLPAHREGLRALCDHARANLLSFSVGGGAVLLHFQAVHRIFCLFCLVYGALILALFILNANRTRRTACAASFAAGLLVFAVFFEGSAVPVFSF